MRPPEVGANAPAVVPQARLWRDGAGGMKPIKRNTPYCHHFDPGLVSPVRRALPRLL
jgi:hypothetical protein